MLTSHQETCRSRRRPNLLGTEREIILATCSSKTVDDTTDTIIQTRIEENTTPKRLRGVGEGYSTSDHFPLANFSDKVTSTTGAVKPIIVDRLVSDMNHTGDRSEIHFATSAPGPFSKKQLWRTYSVPL